MAVCHRHIRLICKGGCLPRLPGDSGAGSNQCMMGFAPPPSYCHISHGKHTVTCCIEMDIRFLLPIWRWAFVHVLKAFGRTSTFLLVTNRENQKTFNVFEQIRQLMRAFNHPCFQAFKSYLSFCATASNNCLSNGFLNERTQNPIPILHASKQTSTFEICCLFGTQNTEFLKTRLNTEAENSKICGFHKLRQCAKQRASMSPSTKKYCCKTSWHRQLWNLALNWVWVASPKERLKNSYIWSITSE